MAHTPKKFTRDLVAQFMENMDADAVVVIWTTSAKLLTQKNVYCIGNTYAVTDMIKITAQEVISRQSKMVKENVYGCVKDDQNL